MHREGRGGRSPLLLVVAPDHALVLFFIGRCHAQLGDRGAAIGYLSRAVKIQDDIADAHVILGDLLTERGSHERALTHYRRALVLLPHDARVQRRVEEIESR